MAEVVVTAVEVKVKVKFVEVDVVEVANLVGMAMETVVGKPDGEVDERTNMIVGHHAQNAMLKEAKPSTT